MVDEYGPWCTSNTEGTNSLMKSPFHSFWILLWSCPNIKVHKIIVLYNIGRVIRAIVRKTCDTTKLSNVIQAIGWRNLSTVSHVVLKR